jgi:hypothetical protein
MAQNVVEHAGQKPRLMGGLPQFRGPDSRQSEKTAKLDRVLADEVKRLNSQRFRHFRRHGSLLFQGHEFAFP